jgi:hypothetical protein
LARAAETAGGQSHQARKALFRAGIRRGWLELAEIERALPPASLSPAERWLLLYSLRAAGVEIRHGDKDGLFAKGRGSRPGT